jgi:CMP-N,N'-diacetyllegionaminic acid synthase
MYVLGGDTLIARAIKTAKQCRFVDRVIVSTDCELMYGISCDLDASMGNLRPAHLAQDDSLTVDVVLDALERTLVRSGWVLLLQATSPLRTARDLEMFCQAWETCTDDSDAMASVVRHMSPHPNKLQVIRNDYLHSYSACESMVPRQSLPPVYALNGCFYITALDILQKYRTFLPRKSIPYVMTPDKSLNLDSPWDMTILEALSKSQAVDIEHFEP